MLLHTLKLSVRALRQDAWRTALMVSALGLGIGAAMTSATVFLGMAANPLPHKEGLLFIPQVDNWPAGSPYLEPGEPPKQLTWRDATALWEARQARRQTITWPNALPVEAEGAAPRTVGVRFATADFFPMFDVPLAFGSSWHAGADDTGEPVAVISQALNQWLFAGRNSVGERIRVSGTAVTVIGVTADWRPQPRLYDFDFDYPLPDDDVFLPARFGFDHQVRSINNDCWPSFSGDYEAFKRSECVWLNLWVEVGNAGEAAQYRAFLDAYVARQKAAGRFPEPANNRLRTVSQWLEARHAVRADVRIQMMLSVAFLAVCLVNTVGLLLAKFLSRTREISVHRALGASRNQVFVRYLAEAGAIGACGSLLGLALTFAGTAAMRVLDPTLERLAQLDLRMIGATLVLALAASLAAGAFPAWRACRMVPAAFLKAD